MSAELLERLVPAIEAHLTSVTGGPATVRGLTPLLGGACQDNLRVDVTLEGEPAGERTLVLRSDAPTSLPDSIDRAAEMRVIQAAVSQGVLTPDVHWPAQGLVREGAHAYFMDWREGIAIGRKVVSSPELEAARATLPASLAAELARIHSITPQTHPELVDALGPAPSDPAAWLLDRLRETVDGLPEPRPPLEYALRWLRDQAPAPAEVTLVHSDFRTGNFLVTPEGLSAVLDWEFAHWSHPLEDVAWITVRDWRFGKLDLPVGGFALREPFHTAYTEASGRKIDPEALHFWEVLGNVRWAAGSLHQGERYRSGAQRDLELIAIARRAVEMEFEALRLIERGP